MPSTKAHTETKQRAGDLAVAAHWAKHLQFVKDVHDLQYSTWDSYLLQWEDWLDLWAAEADDPARCLEVIKKHMPSFCPTVHLQRAIAESEETSNVR